MKKLTLIAAALSLMVIACKKDRTCECTSTSSTSSTEPNYPSSNSSPTKTSMTYKKVKKGNIMIETCVSNVQTTTETYTRTSGGGTATYERTTVYNEDCEVK